MTGEVVLECTGICQLASTYSIVLMALDGEISLCFNRVLIVKGLRAWIRRQRGDIGMWDSSDVEKLWLLRTEDFGVLFFILM